MLGTICLSDLKIICIVGVHPKERELPQTLLVDVEMDLDIGKAAENNDVSATVDYSDVAARLTHLKVRGKYELIETFAEDAAKMLFETYDLIQAIRLTVKKPFAVPQAAYVAVKIARQR